MPLAQTHYLQDPNNAHSYMYAVSQKLKAKVYASKWKTWWEPRNLGKRLYDNMQFAFISDSFIAVATEVSATANQFLTTGIFSLCYAGTCVLPAILPFVPNILCMKDSPINDDLSISEYGIKLVEEDQDLLEFATELAADKKLKLETLVRKKQQAKLLAYAFSLETDREANKWGYLDNLMNAIYLQVRAQAGFATILSYWSLLDEEQNQNLTNVTYWVGTGSTLAYLLYSLLCLLPSAYLDRLNGKKKTTSPPEASRYGFFRPDPIEADFKGSLDVPLLEGHKSLSC